MHYIEAKGTLNNNHGFHGMNIYRGCLHGCIYCDIHSKCYQFDHDFEYIEVKINVPILLEQALRSSKKKLMISTDSMSDP